MGLWNLLWTRYGFKLLTMKGYRHELALTHQNAWREGHKNAHQEARDLMTVMAKEVWAMAEEAGLEGQKEALRQHARSQSDMCNGDTSLT